MLKLSLWFILTSSIGADGGGAQRAQRLGPGRTPIDLNFISTLFPERGDNQVDLEVRAAAAAFLNVLSLLVGFYCFVRPPRICFR